jgi:riboflavin kinase/FMN adenylyltransferase
VVPPDGVYATTLTVHGTIRPGVTNIGVRPTFETDGERVIETHLFDFDGDLYGTRVSLAFIQRLRPEQAFADADALRRQIADDCDQARSLFDRISL